MNPERGRGRCARTPDPCTTAIKHSRSGERHPDWDRLVALFRGGYLAWLGEIMGPHIGGTFTVWQITPAGHAFAERAGSARSAA